MIKRRRVKVHNDKFAIVFNARLRHQIGGMLVEPGAHGYTEISLVQVTVALECGGRICFLFEVAVKGLQIFISTLCLVTASNIIDFLSKARSYRSPPTCFCSVTHILDFFPNVRVP